ncbi:MAG: hypothetical protein BYD32DRAFT_463425 [Podila humilis]|nr:MAG: hypothetical protein BYD32DRAFT_463425 [Podila humilis]
MYHLNHLGDASALSAAIHDAVALANWISTLHIAKLADIDFIFAEYQAERLPVAKEAIKTIRLFKSSRGKSISASLGFRHMPQWLMRLFIFKMVSVRPQLSFLLLIEDTGSSKPI